MNAFVKKSKRLSRLLRHTSPYIDEYGWITIKDLIEKHQFTEDVLKDLVAHDSKKRFKYNEDKTAIKAKGGMSRKITSDTPKSRPPEHLYHGTIAENLQSILAEGLKPMSRIHVSLSTNIDTAKTVGKRHGSSVVILIIDSAKMWSKGFNFYEISDDTWETEHVPPEFISLKE